MVCILSIYHTCRVKVEEKSLTLVFFLIIMYYFLWFSLAFNILVNVGVVLTYPILISIGTVLSVPGNAGTGTNVVVGKISTLACREQQQFIVQVVKICCHIFQKQFSLLWLPRMLLVMVFQLANAFFFLVLPPFFGSDGMHPYHAEERAG